MLSSAERKELKARAHKLEPVVIIGNKGLTAEVVAEIDRALKTHELIKVRVPRPRAARPRADLLRHLREDRLRSGAAGRQGLRTVPEAR